MSLVLVLVLLALAASSGLVRSEQPQPEAVEVFEEGDAVGAPNEVRFF